MFSSTGEFENLLAYPNPTDKIINLSFSTKDEESYQIIMIDAIGKQVYDRKYVSNSGNNQVEIDISELSIGCYNILLIGDNKRDNLRIIKK